MNENSKFIEKVEKFEKNHNENLEKQNSLIMEIKNIQENIVRENNVDLFQKVKSLQEQTNEECEYQKGVEENIKTLKNLLEESSKGEDIAFEENMRELHQDHNRNLHHQIEMMAQIDEMKKIYELDKLDQDASVSDANALKQLETIKVGHDRAFLKQKQMLNDIELIQMNVLSDQHHDDKAVKKIERMKADNEKQLEEQKRHDEKLIELKGMLDSLNNESDIDFEEQARLVTQEHNRSLEHQLQLMMQIDEMKSMYEDDMKERQKMNENSKFIEKVEKFEKNHIENLEKQNSLIMEIKNIQENIVRENNVDLFQKVKSLQEQTNEECEYQKGVEENIKTLKNLLEESSKGEDIAFEEKMRELHQDHNRNLHHQIEMMAQIDEMEKIYELDKLDE